MPGNLSKVTSSQNFLNDITLKKIMATSFTGIHTNLNLNSANVCKRKLLLTGLHSTFRFQNPMNRIQKSRKAVFRFLIITQLLERKRVYITSMGAKITQSGTFDAVET